MESLPEIRITAVNHHGERRILIQFPRDRQLEAPVRQLPDCRWSQSLQGWHVANSPENLRLIFHTFKGIAAIDKTGVFGPVSGQRISERTTCTPVKPSFPVLHDLSVIVSLKVEEFVLWMKHRRYSENTIRTYTDGIKTFLRYHSGKGPEQITNSDLVDFNNGYILKRGYSASFQNQVINAVKLFYKKVEHREIDVDAIERPRREHHLPNVLSKEEVREILAAPVNLKHRTMLSLIYACGLRRSELLNLKPADIESRRGLLESGTDLRYIQELLGHKSSRTTEIYTHVSARSLQKIKSPFDDL